MSRFTLCAAALAMMGSLTGCMDNYPTGVPAPYEASLSIPAGIEVSGDVVGSRNDGYGALFLMDIVVFSDETGYPMDNIQVELLSQHDGIYIIPATAVKLVGGPAELDPSQCDADGDGAVDSNAPDECYWQYDTSSNQYFQFSYDFANVYQPNYMIGPTNEHGILRAYLYIDSMPYDGTSYFSTGVGVMLGHVSEVFTIDTATQ